MCLIPTLHSISKVSGKRDAPPDFSADSLGATDGRVERKRPVEGVVIPVGLVGVGSEPIRVNASLSKQQVMQWLHRLRTFRFDETTSLATRINELSPMLVDRALVIVLSDLHDPRALTALRRLNQKHDCVVLQLQDPAERGLRGSGIFRAQESETGRAFVGHGRQQWLDQPAIDRDLKRGGVDHLLIHTDQPFAQKLRHFFQSRSLLGRGSR